MEETPGTEGNMGLHWDREVSVGVNGSTGNSSIVTQSTPNGFDTHFIYFFFYLIHIFHRHIYVSPMYKLHIFVTDKHRHTAVLRDQDHNPSRLRCVYERR